MGLNQVYEATQRVSRFDGCQLVLRFQAFTQTQETQHEEALGTGKPVARFGLWRLVDG